MQTLRSLLEPKVSPRILASRELELRQRSSEQPDEEHPLTQWVRVLELHLAVSAIHESIHEIGARTLALAMKEIGRLIPLASSIAGLDVAQILAEEPDLQRAPAWTHADQPAGADMTEVLRSVRSLLAYCPLGDLEGLSRTDERAALGHRCRVAYEALEAFVRRNDPRNDAAARTAGRAYAEGRLSASEVASVLGLDPSDAVAYLEAHGFCRPLDVIRLAPEDRHRTFAAIREDRRFRSGQPRATPKLVQREVIASQRIEGVDARPWIPRD